MSKNKVGLTLGILGGFCHLVWAIIVAAGQGQAVLNWFSKMHLLNNPYTVGTLDFGGALLLVVMGFVIWYVTGWLFAFVWGLLHK